MNSEGMVSKYSEISKRYAIALFEVSTEKNEQELVLGNLRNLKKIFSSDEIKEFFIDPIVQASEKEQALKKAIESKGINENVEKLVLLIAKKNRLGSFDEIVDAFQDKLDETNGVTRGLVRSKNILSTDERLKVEKIVNEATGKTVILTYKEDPNVIGGLVAEVGSYTFNDSIDFHLKNMQDKLNRRVH